MKDSIISGGLGLAGDLLGGALNHFSASSEARKQRKFIKYMSNTQYQRGVKDLVAAGLNPMLAYMSPGAHGSGGTGGGAAAAGGTRMGSIGSSAISAAQNAKLLEANISNINTASAKNVAEANRATAEADNIRGVARDETIARTGEIGARTESIRKSMELTVEQINAARTENEQREAFLSLQRQLMAAQAMAAGSASDMRQFAIELGRIGVELIRNIRSPSFRDQAGELLRDTKNLIEDKAGHAGSSAKDAVRNLPRTISEWGKRHERQR